MHAVSIYCFQESLQNIVASANVDIFLFLNLLHIIMTIRVNPSWQLFWRTVSKQMSELIFSEILALI